MPWTMGRLMELATGYWPAAALSAAVELRIFEALGGGRSRTAPELAETRGLSERGAAELLDTLTALGLLSRDDRGAYALVPDAAAFLDPVSPSCLLPALEFNADLYPLWGRLAQAVRMGAPVLPPAAHLGQDAGRTRRFAMGMHSRALGLAPALLPALGLEPGGGRFDLLDVGAGPGTFSRALAEGNPRLYVTQFDLPAVLAVAEDLAGASPARDRIGFRPGDYRGDDLGGPYDGVLYCGALHQENPSTAGILFRRIWSALKPGGRLWLVDLMIAPDRNGPAFAHLFSLQMLLTSPFGRVFAEDEALALLAAAGFHSPDLRRLDRLPYTVIRADR
jgi:SAM-dependent methyltransferase